jgi:hypothetical protein
MATPVDQEFLNGINTRRKTNYQNVNDYLTKNGAYKKGSDAYNRRLGAVKDFRSKNKRKQTVLSGGLIEESKKIFGSLADLYNIPELKSIFENAFIEEWTPDELIRQIDNTDWAKTRTEAQETFDVLDTTNPVQAAAQVDANIPIVRRVLSSKGISLSDDQIKTIAQKGTRNGWNGNQWDTYSASEAIAISNATPATPDAPASPSISPVTASDLRGIAKEFGVPVTENTINQWVNEILTNTKTREQFGEYARSSAQTLYPSISDRLQTSTFDQIVSPYKQLYAQVLETPEDNIDLTNPQFSNLFTGNDPANPRMMTSTEWVSTLRRRPEWQNTQNAYREYSSAADTLNKIFGGMR